MVRFGHISNPLSENESNSLLKLVSVIGDSTVARRIIETTGPLGPGAQTVPAEILVGITDGTKGLLREAGTAVKATARQSRVVPIIWKDFVIHWRDLEQSRQNRNLGFSLAKAAAAAACCARSEDQLVLYGDHSLGYSGLMTVDGSQGFRDLRWSQAGDAFSNISDMIRTLARRGHSGPFSAIVSPNIYSNMHRVLKGSPLLEVTHVRALLAGGLVASPLLRADSGLVLSNGKQNVELLLCAETSLAFLGAKKMNLPFRVFKSLYLNVRRADSICTFGNGPG
jgi:uncharacterized linocin/CFP29 family protein